MSEYIVQDTTLTNIADAIRSKTGGTNSITVNNMANEIDNISTKSDLSFITAGAEQILSGYIGADKDGNPVNGKNSSRITVFDVKTNASITSGRNPIATVTFDNNDYNYFIAHVVFLGDCNGGQVRVCYTAIYDVTTGSKHMNTYYTQYGMSGDSNGNGTKDIVLSGNNLILSDSGIRYGEDSYKFRWYGSNYNKGFIMGVKA